MDIRISFQRVSHDVAPSADDGSLGLARLVVQPYVVDSPALLADVTHFHDRGDLHS